MYPAIKREYDAFYRHRLSQGKLPMKETEEGVWGKAIIDEVHELFKKIELNKYKNFLDLGSGDGCVTLVASTFTKASGIEIDKELLLAGVNIRDKLKLNAIFVNGNYLLHDIDKYDIIFINPDKPFFRGLDRFLETYAGTVVVYDEHFLPSHMKLVKDLRSEKINAFIYRN